MAYQQKCCLSVSDLIQSLKNHVPASHHHHLDMLHSRLSRRDIDKRQMQHELLLLVGEQVLHQAILSLAPPPSAPSQPQGSTCPEPPAVKAPEARPELSIDTSDVAERDLLAATQMLEMATPPHTPPTPRSQPPQSPASQVVAPQPPVSTQFLASSGIQGPSSERMREQMMAPSALPRQMPRLESGFASHPPPMHRPALPAGAVVPSLMPHRGSPFPLDSGPMDMQQMAHLKQKVCHALTCPHPNCPLPECQPTKQKLLMLSAHAASCKQPVGCSVCMMWWDTQQISMEVRQFQPSYPPPQAMPQQPRMYLAPALHH